MTTLIRTRRRAPEKAPQRKGFTASAWAWLLLALTFSTLLGQADTTPPLVTARNATVQLDAQGQASVTVADVLEPNVMSIVDSGQNLGSADSVNVDFGDLDGDGDLDAFVSNDSSVNRIYFNNGGTFTDSGQSIGSTSDRTQDAALFDFDGDGDLDVFVSNFDRTPNEVYFNNGAGVFINSGQTIGAENDNTLVIGDIDGDGDPDVVTANFGDFVYLNDGNGGFTPAGTIGSSRSVGNALGDLDGDGDLDFFDSGIVGDPDLIWLNDGAGNFTNSGQVLGNNDTWAVALTDVDKDGDLDAVTAQRSNQGNRVWLNDGNATFTDSGQSLGSSTSNAVSATDLNQDGYPDLIFANIGSPDTIWLNDRNGQFTHIGFSVGGNSSGAGVATGDIDGDGDNDAMFAILSGGNRVFFNQSTIHVSDDECLAFISAAPLQFNSLNLGPNTVVVTATDAAGNQGHSTAIVTVQDALPPSVTTQNIVLQLDANGQTSIVPTDVILSNTLSLSDTGQSLGGADSVSVDLGDLDGDGDLDAFVSNDSSVNRVYFNNGNGGFTDSGQSIGSSSDRTQDAALFDFDGDGDLDVFVSNFDRTPNEVYFNDGTGFFTNSGQAIGAVNDNNLAMGDIDGDGDPDIITGSGGDFVYLNNGGGIFAAAGTIGASRSVGVALGDLDGDGDLDIFEGGIVGETDRVWLNDGAGNFTDSGQQLGNLDTWGIALVDVDKDGDLDAVTAHRSNQGNRVWLNDGNANFTDSGQSLGNSTSNAVSVTDINRDGHPDLIFANISAPNTVWINDRTGQFTNAGFNLGSSTVDSGVATGDLDGDGDNDAFFAVIGGGNQVFLNQSTIHLSDNGCIESLTVNPNTFDCDDLGLNTVTLTIADSSGNSVSPTATVTIQDTQAPIISCPANIALNNDPGQCGATVSWILPQVIDNCATTLTSSHTSGTFFAIGTTTVTYTATDAAGNMDTCSFTVTVNDAESPVISLVGDNPLQVLIGTPYIDPGSTVSDCETGLAAVVDASGVNTSLVGTYTVFYNVSDTEGNTATTVTRSVEVFNNPPQLTVSSTTINVDEGQTASNSGTFNDPDPNEDLTLSYSVGSGTGAGGQSVGQNGTWQWIFNPSDGIDDSQLVTVTATDNVGEQTQASFQLNVNNVAPSVAADLSTVTVDEGQTALNSGSFFEPGLDAVAVSASVGNIVNTTAPAASVFDFSWVGGTGSNNSVNTSTTTLTGAIGVTLQTDNVGHFLENSSVAIGGGNIAQNAEVTLTFTQPISSVRLQLTDLDFPDEKLTNFSILPASTDGDLSISGTEVVSAAENGAGNIRWENLPPGTNEITFTYERPASGGLLFDEIEIPGSQGTWSWEFASTDGPLESQLVTITATDEDGASSTANFNLVVSNIAPDFEAGPSESLLPPVAGAFARTGIPFTDPGLDSWSGTVDYGDGPPEALLIDQIGKTLSLNHTYQNSGIFNVLVTLSDGDGGTHQDGFAVDVTLNSPPIAVCNDLVLNADPINCNAVIPTGPISAGSSDPDGDPIVVLLNPNTPLPPGIHQVTVTIQDPRGETDSCVATVTVLDTTPPMITLAGANPQTIECPADYVELGATAFDTCDTNLGPIQIDASGVNTAVPGSYIVTYNISDASGNAATQVTRSVNVVDTTPPTITLTGANPQTIECPADYVELGATAVDTCDTNLGPIQIDASGVNTAIPGSYIVTYNISDASGNAATPVTRTVNVVDSTPPTITLTGANPQTIECPADYVELGATAFDTCDTNLGPIQIDASGVNTAVPGSYIVTYNISDASGNAATQVTRTVNVVDTTPPTITLTGANPQTIECPADYVELGATAADTCDTNLGPIQIDASGVNTAIPGSYIVTYNISDASGNAATQVTRTVNVVDTTPPVITLSGANPQTIECPTDYVELGATAVDTCDTNLGPIQIDASGVNTAIPGSYVVTYNISDASGNAATQVTRTVNVVDTTPPTITLTGANPQTIECPADYVELGATAFDTCDTNLGPIQIDATGVNTAVPGSYIVTYNISDASGNTATQVMRTVNVVDTTPPVITLVGYSPQYVECPGPYFESGATATDTCEGDLTSDLVIDATDVESAIPGSYLVRYTVTDPAGNSTTIERQIEVTDTTSPDISINGTNSVYILQGDPYTEEGATASDSCDTNLAVSTGGDIVNTAIIGNYWVTYDAMDSSGNKAETQTRLVTVLPRFAALDAVFGCEEVKTGMSASVHGSIGSSRRVQLNSATVIDGDITNVAGPVDLQKRVQVNGSVDAGGKTTLRQNSAVVGNVISGNRIDLLKAASIVGDATAAGKVKLARGATVTGSITENTVVPPLAEIPLPVLNLTTSGQNVSVKRNQAATLLPDAYRKLTGKRNSTVQLSNGYYSFSSIDLDLGSSMVLDLTLGPIHIDVVGKVDLDGVAMELIGGTADQVLLQSTGSKIRLGTNRKNESGSSILAGPTLGTYHGTFIAPNGTITLEVGGSLHGSLISRKIHLQSRSEVVSLPALALVVQAASNWQSLESCLGGESDNSSSKSGSRSKGGSSKGQSGSSDSGNSASSAGKSRSGSGDSEQGARKTSKRSGKK